MLRHAGAGQRHRHAGTPVSDACSGSAFSPGLQNSTPGVGVTCQRCKGTVGPIAPWSPIATTPALTTSQTVALSLGQRQPGMALDTLTAGVLLHAQSAALVTPVAPHNAGSVTSNGVRPFRNTF